MSFPFALGGGIGGPSISGFRRLLKRLLPSGYAEAAPLLDELEVFGVMLFDAHTTVQRVANNAFVDIADDMLEEWEHEYGLPNDAARTPDQRRARLEAAERAIGGAIRARVEGALQAVSPGAAWLVPTQEDLFFDDIAPSRQELIFQQAVQLSESEWAKPAVRRAVARVLQRMTAARAHFQHGYGDPEEAVVAKVDAEWNSADHVIGRDALRRGTALTIDAYSQVATLRRYGPLSKVRAADLNAIQDATVYRRVTAGGLDALPGVQADRVALAFAVSCAAGPGTTILDEGTDWRYRLVTVWTSAATDDIRPGGASDQFVGTSTITRLIWYPGSGCTDALAATNAYAVELLSGVWLYADGTTGALKLRNANGGTRYVVGMLHGTGPSNNAALRNETRLTTFADGDTFAAGGLDAAWHTAWKRACWTRRGEGTVGVDAWSSCQGDGGAFIVAVVPNVLPGDTKAIDRFRDWRDRLIAVTCVSIQLDTWSAVGSTDPAWPGSSRFDQLQRNPSQPDHLTNTHHTAFTYTRLGEASGASITGTMCALEAEARVWVDTSGFLRLTRDADDAQTSAETYILLIHASEQTGERSTPGSAYSTLAAVDGDPIHPQQLTQPQERGLCVPATSPEGLALDVIPLGPVSPPQEPTLPETWPLANPFSVGAFSQDVAGWARVYFSGVLPANQAELVLDASRDWRDRFVWASVATSTTLDRTIGGSADWGINSTSGTTRHSTARYTGDGAPTIWANVANNPYAADVEGSGYELRLTSVNDVDVITVYARESDGALCIASADPADLAVTVMVEATFQLGLRKAR